MRIRTFFALRMSDSVVRQLADQADGLCAYDRKLEVEWVDSDNYHLTLCFLGDTDLEDVDKLEIATKEALKDHLSFQVKLKKVGYYEINSELSLIAALPAKNDELKQLQQVVAGLVQSVGIENSTPDFKPHITLGKLPIQNGFDRPEKWPKFELFSLADSVVLFQSKKGEHGSIYTPLFEIDLQDLS